VRGLVMLLLVSDKNGGLPG